MRLCITSLEAAIMIDVWLILAKFAEVRFGAENDLCAR